MEWEAYQKECYLLSRYKDKYLADGSFEGRATALIERGMGFSDGIPYMEEMLGRTAEYDEADARWAPILIYVGDPLCYGVLDAFGRQLGAALSRVGETVEYYDIGANDISGLADFVGLRYTAVIGLQSYAFAVKLGDGTNLHDKIIGPKFNMILDHPVWLRDHLENGPESYYVLTHDANYVSFIKKYFPKVREAYLLPPGGMPPENAPYGRTSDIDENSRKSVAEIVSSAASKRYPLSFVGSYHDWRLWKRQVSEANRKTHGVARAFLHYMLHHTELTWEDGLSDVLYQRGENVFSDAFRDLLFEIKPVCFVVMSYFREKMIDAIAESGLEMHVFGDSWSAKRYSGYKNIILHPNVTPEESLRVYAESAVSLNIMSWHKGGMTERIANMMLQGAVVATDPSSYLTSHYAAGEDYIELSLYDIESVPRQLSEAISDSGRCEKMAASAYKKAIEAETWDARADKLLWILSAQL